MKKNTIAVLVTAVLLSACGGGGSSSDQPSDLTPSADTRTDAESILAAPTQVNFNGARVSATAWLPATNATTAGHAIAAGQQGGYVELRTDTSIDWSTVKLSGFAKALSGQVQVVSNAAAGVRPSAINSRVAYLFVPNQIGYQYLALKVAVGNLPSQWVRLQNNACLCTHAVMTTMGLSGGTNGPRVEPVFMQRLDFAGTAAVVQSMLFKDDGITTEADAMNGMMTYGETDKIRARGGFSMLDVKRYLVARGYVAAGYSVSEQQDYAALLNQADIGLVAMLTLDGYQYTVWVTAMDSNYLYVSSPHFGSLAIRWSALQSPAVVLTVAHPTAP